MTDNTRSYEIVRTQGRRLTPQRRLVLEILNETQDHLDADALYARAKARDEHISLATVYRSLSMLKQVGLVIEHNLGQDHGHFEPVKSTPHYHFSCQECGRVIEFSSPQIEKVLRDLHRSQGLLVTHAYFHVSGLCPACQQKSSPEDTPSIPKQTKIQTEDMHA